jgi:chromosome segregation ATPase
MRINAIEAELKQTHNINGQMKKDVKELKEKLDDVDVELSNSQARCNHLAEDNEKLLEQLRLQREELEAERMTNAQLAEQLTLESSRTKFGRTLTRTESIIKSSEVRIMDLDAQVRALKLENEKLKHENDELRERAVAAGIDEGRRLMADPNTPSYAAELEVLSKDELVTINRRLREYIDSLLVQILLTDPTILEKQ